MPKISILMPVYNAEKFLDESIGSLLNQTFKDFEILILDDASSDNSLEVIQKYKLQDKRIQLFEGKKNLGFSKGKNFLLEKISGEYIAWLDADDLFLQNKLKTQIDFLNSYPDIQVLGTWGKKIFPGGDTHLFPTPVGSCNIHHNFLFWNGIIQSSSIFHHSLVTEKKIKYREDIASAEDYQFWVDVSQFAKFENIAKVLTLYRVHDKQESAKNNQRQISCHLQIVKKKLTEVPIFCDDTALSQFLFFTPESEQEYRSDILVFVKKILAINNKKFNYFSIKVLRQYYKYLRVFFPESYKKIFLQDFSWRDLCNVKLFPIIERHSFY